MKKLSVLEWHKRFKECRENVEDEERSGRPRSHHRTSEKCRNWCIQTDVQLNLDEETVKKGLNYGLRSMKYKRHSRTEVEEILNVKS